MGTTRSSFAEGATPGHIMAVGTQGHGVLIAIFFALEATMKDAIFLGSWISPTQDAKVDELAAVRKCSKSALVRHLIDLAEVGLVLDVRLSTASQEASGDDVA